MSSTSPVAAMKTGESVQFTFFWLDAQTWEGTNYSVDVVAP